MYATFNLGASFSNLVKTLFNLRTSFFELLGLCFQLGFAIGELLPTFGKLRFARNEFFPAVVNLSLSIGELGFSFRKSILRFSFLLIDSSLSILLYFISASLLAFGTQGFKIIHNRVHEGGVLI